MHEASVAALQAFFLSCAALWVPCCAEPQDRPGAASPAAGVHSWQMDPLLTGLRLPKNQSCRGDPGVMCRDTMSHCVGCGTISTCSRLGEERPARTHVRHQMSKAGGCKGVQRNDQQCRGRTYLSGAHLPILTVVQYRRIPCYGTGQVLALL